MAILSRRLRTLQWLPIGKSLLEVLIASAGMALFLAVFQYSWPILASGDILRRLTRLITALFSAGLLYLMLLWILKNPELIYMFHTLKKRRG